MLAISGVITVCASSVRDSSTGGFVFVGRTNCDSVKTTISVNAIHLNIFNANLFIPKASNKT